MKQSQAAANSPAPSNRLVSPAPSNRLVDLSTSIGNLSIGSLLKPSLSRSSSNRSISVDGKAYDRAHLCDEVLAAHFSAASQGLRLEAIEERASKADQEMSKAKAELAATEAQEAMQCVMWKSMFEAEINSAKIYREKAEHAEVRLKSSKTEASQAKSEQLEVDRLRAEVVDRGAGWATERERLLDEIYELQASLASQEGRVAGFELQVQKSYEAAAQATVMRCNELEALAMVRQEAGRANLRVEASESQRVNIEQQRIEAAALAEAMKLELDMARKNEETAVAMALAEARSEAVLAREAKTQIAELQIEVSENETLARVQALENERRKDAEEATRMHADAQQALELLCSFVQQRENESSSKEQDASALKDFEARILAQSEAAASKEADAIAEAKTEATVAVAAQKHCSELRAELIAQSRAQRDLHNELQALSNAAAAVRAVASAKDETISELQATSRLMVSELAMSGKSPAMIHRKTLDAKSVGLELTRASGTSGTSGSSTVGDGSMVTPASVTPSDVLSQASTQTLGAAGRYRSAANAQEGPTHSAYDRSVSSSLVDRVRSGSPLKGVGLGLPIATRTPSRSLPAPYASPARPHDFPSPSQEETVNPHLSQAAAFLNAAAAKAAAAASAVEAFFPFVPPTVPTTSSQEESTPTGAGAGSEAPTAATSDIASKAAPSRKADKAALDSSGSSRIPLGGSSRYPAGDKNQSTGEGSGGKSWEEAQAVMTEQIRKDISLLRKALSDTGMRGSPLEEEVHALARQTEAKLGLQQPKDDADKRIPLVIKDTMIGSNMRRHSPTQKIGGMTASFSTGQLPKSLPESMGGSMRARRSPERQISAAIPQHESADTVHIPVAEVVMVGGERGSSYSVSSGYDPRQPSLEGSMRRSPEPRPMSMRMPPADRSTSITKGRETGKLMASASEASLGARPLLASASEAMLGARPEANMVGLLASASEVSLGQGQAIKATNLTVGPARGAYMDVGVGSGRFSSQRSGSPPVSRQPWHPGRNVPQPVNRLVSVPARCKSPIAVHPGHAVARIRSSEGTAQLG